MLVSNKIKISTMKEIIPVLVKTEVKSGKASVVFPFSIFNNPVKDKKYLESVCGILSK